MAEIDHTIPPMSPRELATFGFARARDLMFDAVRDLYERRRTEGLTVEQIAERIGRKPAWVKRHLSGPGQWTLRTFGELVEAMDGDVEVCVLPDKAPMVQVLSDRLYAKTRHISSIGRMTEMPEFAKLLELGDETVRYILSEMWFQQTRIFWFVLLRRITGANPVPEQDRGYIDKMRERWVAWGKEHGPNG